MKTTGTHTCCVGVRVLKVKRCSMTATEKIRLDVNMKDNPAQVTWENWSDVLTLKLMNTDVELKLDLGPDVIRQIKQAFSRQVGK